MTTSLAEYLEQDMECEGLLECIFGLTELDKHCYNVLIESDAPLTIDEIAEGVDRERSTAYRSIQRLHDAGLIQREQINYDHGGYYHVFSPRPVESVTAEMQRTLNDWYAKMGQLIHEFEQTYADRIEETATVEG